jgi:hypothetical protein
MGRASRARHDPIPLLDKPVIVEARGVDPSLFASRLAAVYKEEVNNTGKRDEDVRHLR